MSGYVTYNYSFTLCPISGVHSSIFTVCPLSTLIPYTVCKCSRYFTMCGDFNTLDMNRQEY